MKLKYLEDLNHILKWHKKYWPIGIRLYLCRMAGKNLFAVNSAVFSGTKIISCQIWQYKCWETTILKRKEHWGIGC